MGRCGLRFLPAHRSPCQRGHTALHIDRLTSDYTKKLKRCLTMTVHGAIPGNTTRNYVYGSPIQALKKGLPKQTQSLCPDCSELIGATIFEDGGKVVMEKHCKNHGDFRDIVYGDVKLYLRLRPPFSVCAAPVPAP